MATCLRKILNVTGYDSRDDNGGERFIQYDPLRLASLPNNYERYFQFYVKRERKWAAKFMNWTVKWGIDAIAPSAISFHKIQPAVKMRRYEWLLYRMNNSALSTKDCEGYEQVPVANQ